MKVLHVCAVAFGLETLLLPQIDYLRGRGLSVEAACSPDPRVKKLRARGYTIHEIQIDRRISPVPNSKSVLELVDFIGEQGLDSQVTFGGFRDDVQDLLGLLDVFVLPSYREVLPRSVLEAMAMGLPVVATRIRGCREAVVDQETGMLVPARDASALKQAIAQILSNRELARRFGKAGRERVVTAFDEQFVFARLENYYRKLGVSFA